MWVILQIDDLSMVRKIALRLAEKAKYDSNRRSHCNGSQRINFCLSCVSLITLDKSLNGIYDVLILP